MKVNFAICGTQKGGTTALDSYLRDHPEVCMSQKKEVHFFDNGDFFDGGEPDYSNYHSWFQPKPEQRVIGEATPIYMYWKSAAQRMHAYNPDMRLIFLLRNPVERAFSHWNMEYTRGAENLSFHHALQAESDRLHEAAPLQHRVYSYLDRGNYCDQLRRIENIFPKSNLLVLKQEELSGNPKGTLESVSDFLGISAFQKISPRNVHALPYAASMSKTDSQFLRDAFFQEIKELEKHLGWDCSDWLDYS